MITNIILAQATPFDPQHRICIASYRHAEKWSGGPTILYLFHVRNANMTNANRTIMANTHFEGTGSMPE